MKHFIVYKPSGEIMRVGTCSERDYELQAGDDELLMEGTANNSRQYIENGSVVDMPPKPDGWHDFDFVNKSWIFNTKVASSMAYLERNRLLKDGPDRINPAWWASMTPAQQNAWSQYRQDLLDVPQQPSFPMNIIWPISP
jgi:hypothetical protein